VTAEYAGAIPPYSAKVDEAERIRNALAAANGKIDRAAKLLGMSRATFWRKRKQQGL
jgi:transcriptional regulator of acetoin/glycerol metabolism